MPHSNGNITAPISISDIKECLGNTSNDVGTLCTSSKVNKWSKYKPFRHSYFGFDEDTDSTKSDRATAMSNANYGLNPPTTRSATQIHNCLTDTWTYNKPRGLSYSEPYRMADFKNYAHKAVPPIVSMGNVEINAYFTYGDIIVGNTPNVPRSQYFLEYSDFGIFDTLPRLAVYLQDNSDSNKRYVQVLDDMPNAAVVLSKTELNKVPGTNFKYALLATNRISTDGSFISNDNFGTSTWLALPNDEKYSVTGNINYSTDFHHTMSFVGFGAAVALANNTDYTKQIPSYVTESSSTYKNYFYYPVTTQHNTFIKVSFKNTGEDVIFKRNLFAIELSATINSTTNTGYYTPAKIYVGTTEYEEIPIANGETKQITFQLPDDVFRWNSSHQASTIISYPKVHKTIDIRIKYNTPTAPIFTVPFRIRNYQ